MNKLSYSRARNVAVSTAAEVFRRIPGSLAVARLLGPSCSLRCVVFHNISAAQSPFTAGIRVNVTPKRFEAALRALTANYAPVRLEDVLTNGDGHGLPPRALLVTFDDAYASVAEWAGPLCRRYGVPAVFFVNAAFVDNQRLAPDNLVCYVANVLGMEKINSAAQAIPGFESLELHSLAEVFGVLFQTISLNEREVFLNALRKYSGIDECRMAKDANLYLTGKQLQNLTSIDFEIGNHTYTHTHCRCLSQQEFVSEVDRNKRELEALTGTAIRSFSVPYGSSKDLTPQLADHLKRTGHETVFLSESVANPREPDLFHLDRVSTCAESESTLIFEIEVLPRLRALRDRMFRSPSTVRTAQTHSLADRQELTNRDCCGKAEEKRKHA